MSENQKTFVGSGKATSDYHTNITIELTNPAIAENVFEYNGKKYIKLTIGKKREEDKHGKTHYVAINDYKPKEETEQPIEAKSENDLPF